MLQMTINQNSDVLEKMDLLTLKPTVTETLTDRKVDEYLARLSPNSSWGDRQKAAKKLGYMRNPAAVSGLLTALPSDPFWMVRCAIIQALEKIGDPRAIPALQRVEQGDSFQVVRSHAAKAVTTLSRKAA